MPDEEQTEDQLVVDQGVGRKKLVDVSYPSNSKANKVAKPEKKERLKPVVTSEPIKRKKTLAQRIGASMINEDGGTVLQYLVGQVLLPAAKETITDLVSQGIERLLYGDSHRPRSSGGYRPNYTSYNRVRSGQRERDRDDRPRARGRYSFDDVILSTRGEAEEVLDQLRELIDNFDQATVGDFYDLCGMSQDFTDEKYGWDDLRDAKIRRIRDGYLLDLPRPIPLD